MEKFTSFLVMQHAKIINIYKYVYEHQNNKKNKHTKNICTVNKSRNKNGIIMRRSSQTKCDKVWELMRS